ncbi:hypothetical protein [Halorubrum aethiopicum]|uniref:hypothetical protein n=1 Tax=Halorubrum aethiopicum TaxID=1758255 RepID=UPI00082D6667|nr:hypothetical protein [Halorubrum aethiopicum]
MTASDLGHDAWSRLLEQLDDPPVGTVAEALADARDLDVGVAYDRVEEALAEGVLVEEEDGSAFGVVRLDETAETSDSDDTETRGDGSPDDDPEGEGGETGVEQDVTGEEPSGSWQDAEFSEGATDEYPPELLEREQWMGHREKLPFAPWADRDHPEADPEDDARFKWGLEENYVDGETVAIAEDDPRLDGRVFLQQHDDPYAFVDGDDVRDPETGEVHPEFVRILEALGITYADVSTSGGGVHAYYRGDLPRGLPEAKFTIDDEPWGSHDDVPAVEIYANKHVCVATGDHVTGTPLGVAEWDTDGLEDVLDEYGELPEETTADDREEYDLDGYEPTATGSDETTDDIRDIFRALDRLDPKRVGERTIVREWTQDRRSFLPTWGSADDGGTANYIDDRIWHDTGHDGGYGGPAVMAAIDAGLINHAGAEPSDVSGETFFEAIDHLRDLGFSIPKLERSRGGDEEEYGRDPREVTATVDPRRAWDAAGRVTPDEVDDLEAAADAPDRFACPATGEAVDVVRAVAVREELVGGPDEPLDDVYPQAYAIARETYGAPLPAYYTTSDAIAEFDAVLDVIGEATYWDLNTDALATEETASDGEVGGDAVRALNPAWRESESEASVLVFESGTIWDADTERVLDVVRFAALDAGIIDDPNAELAGGAFTDAYRTAREEYGAPLPRWEPAEDGARELTAQLPPAEELLDARDVSGVDSDALDDARGEVERLIRDAATEDGSPTIVTALPATGKTTGTVKTARERPLSYLAPRKELQAQALDKAERWGVDARILPVFSDERVDDGILGAATEYVREGGKDRLRDRWSVVANALDGATDEDRDVDAEDLFTDGEDDEVPLDRPTCPTADGEHGPAWALVAHVARRLGYTPREIHTQAHGLFGAELPCSGEETCDYSAGWEHASDDDDTADLLVGSYVHAHVPSVRTAYSRDGRGRVETAPRAVVLDEFVGEAFAREFDDLADDHATWLARSLRDDVEDRRDVYQRDLGSDEWVRSWLRGDGSDDDRVDAALSTLARVRDLFDAREGAAEIREEVDADLLRQLDVAEPLAAIDVGRDPAAAFRELTDALDALDPEQPGAGIEKWIRPAVVEPLANATVSGASTPGVEELDADGLPIAGDLRQLVERALDSVREGDDAAPARLDAAATALRGGREGCRRLAAWADDGYAHPDAHHLLEAVIADGDEPGTSRVETDAWAFDDRATDGTSLDVVDTHGRATTVLDRNGHGAMLHNPPARTDAGGGDVPLVGLDATGRTELWSVALGEDVTVDDIHDGPAERAAFLEDALDLRVLRAADRPRYYEGSPASKDTDGDVALLEAVAEEYAGIDAPRERGGEAVTVGGPAAITTKGVREVLENDDRLDDVVSAWENYGNVKGSNELGEHRLAAILGCQHYGDHAIERFAALAGEEVDTDRRNGRGAELAYASEIGDAYLKHMTEDQTTQAILRFARGDSGATVVARTSALREDLPVVGEAQVAETWSETATTIARHYRTLGREFTTADVREVVDVGPRQVRRVLAELADAGYIRRVEEAPGRATTYERVDEPGAGEVELPERDEAVATGGHAATNVPYTWNVRVFGGEIDPPAAEPASPVRVTGAPPAPDTVDGVEPPG